MWEFNVLFPQTLVHTQVSTAVNHKQMVVRKGQFYSCFNSKFVLSGNVQIVLR